MGPQRTAYVLGGVLAGALCLWWVGVGDHVDLEVYRRAGERWLEDTDPYAVRRELPFTYPPFAAAVAGLVAGAPLVALTVLSVATLAAATGGVLAASAPRPGSVTSARPWTGRTVLVVVAAAASEPVLRTLQLGQVNGVVVGLVLLDLLVVPPRWRGWLTGIAAGIKLTPVVFVVHLLVRGERAAAARLVAGLAGTVAVGVAALPGATSHYWGSLVLDADRVGAPGFVDNQSLLGAASRLVPSSATPVWLASASVVVAVGAVAIRRRRSGAAVEGVLVCALVGLLVSPVSWSHHWLVLPAAALLCWREGHRVVGAVALTVAVTAPHWRLASHVDVGSAEPGPLALLSSASMTLAGLGCLVTLALARRPGHPGARETAASTRAPAVDRVPAS